MRLVFAEFPSAVAAINMAVEFQKKLKSVMLMTPHKSNWIPYRYKHGWCCKQGNKNLMGDGVNIAARLEAFAQPGGITIAKNVYDFVVENKVWI